MTVPRARRLAALLAALAVVGGGSAYAASDEVRSVVDKVVRVIVPGAVIEPADANAADFSLRPIDEVPGITPVAILTPDLEFPELRGAPYRGGTGRAEGETGVPASAVSGGPGFSTNEAVAYVNPVAQPKPKMPPQLEEPQALSPIHPDPDSGQLEPSAPIELVAQPESGVVPALTPVPVLDHQPALGNPHSEPPGQIKHDDEDEAEVVQDAELGSGRPDEKPEHPHAGDLPPGLGHVVADNPDHPQASDAPGPNTNVVTPVPSIVEPTENIFVPPETAVTPPETTATPAEPIVVPPESPAVPTPPVPAIRPPEYVPDELIEETPTSE